MASEDKEKRAAELKAHAHGMAKAGEQVGEHARTMKAIGKCFGRLFGKEMKNLVVHGRESVPVNPAYPVESGNAEEKAAWRKERNRHLKNADLCDLSKARHLRLC